MSQHATSNEQPSPSNRHTEDLGFSHLDGHIPFEGLANTRDLGYLKTRDGLSLLPHKLLRSGALASATDEDIEVLEKTFGVHTVVDLRTQEEQEKAPDPKDRMQEATFVDAPILGFSATGVTRENGLAGLAKDLSTLTRDPRQLMIDLYPTMLLDSTGIKGYQRFFATLLNEEEGAVLWHCSAGKDRAGLASVLLLHVLGVPTEAIVADYLTTNKYLASREDAIKKLIPEEYLSERLLEGLKTLNSASKDFLDAGIAGVSKEYGSLDAYLSEALDVSEEAKSLLRNKYLTS